MEDPAFPEADAAVTQVDRTVRTRTDAIIEDKRASLRYALAHSVGIETSRLLRGIPAEDFNAAALFKRIPMDSAVRKEGSLVYLQ